MTVGVVWNTVVLDTARVDAEDRSALAFAIHNEILPEQIYQCGRRPHL
jgi:hypothetical protein